MALPAAADLPPERRALQVVHGEERMVDAELARARGLTLVDLSDGWAPAIFQDGGAATAPSCPTATGAIFVGLASDRTDGDGQPLRPGEKNYLELYGIPPSLSVLRARFLADGASPLHGRGGHRQAAGGGRGRHLGRRRPRRRQLAQPGPAARS